MKKQSTNRAYNFSDSELYLECKQRISFAKRDLAEFQSYGYSEERLITFENNCEKFANLPSDDELLGTQMLLTEKKYKAAEKLRTAIRSVMMRVAMKYNNRSGRYRRFGTAKLGDMSDPHLLFCGRRVARVARQQIPFLSDVGLNEILIQKVVEATQGFENAVHIQKDKVAERDIAVESRTALGNIIYKEMVILSNIGKDIWVEKDAVRYEQYVIYESNAEQKRARKARLAAEEANKST